MLSGMSESGAAASSAPQVSVVIPALNAAGTLGVQLEALARQDTGRPFEVLVADNGSTDGTAELIDRFTERLPGLRRVDASARTGTNYARNCGARAARGEYVLMCDADDEVDQGWMEALARALERADTVGGRLERRKLNPHLSDPEGDNGITTRHGFLPRPIGANAGYRRAVWEALGGFNEDYTRGGTETEFFWRAQLAGYTLVDVPDAVVHYRMRTNVSKSVKQMYIWGRQSAMLFRDFKDSGMRWDVMQSVREWVWLLRLAWGAPRDPRMRLDLRLQSAYRAGRVVGSLKYRVLFV